MKGRVKYSPKGILIFAHNWGDFVSKPAANGYYIEAFSAADALIDDEIKRLISRVFPSAGFFIEQAEEVRTKTELFGLGMAEILNNLDVVPDELMDLIRKWKKARNIVSHDSWGEYALVVFNKEYKYANQEELDSSVQKAVDHWLNKGVKIFIDLQNIAGEVVKHDFKYYESAEFIKKQQEKIVKISQRRFPKLE